jgi:hypothetical protein
VEGSVIERSPVTRREVEERYVKIQTGDDPSCLCWLLGTWQEAEERQIFRMVDWHYAATERRRR